MSSANAEWVEALAAEVEPAEVLVLSPDQPSIEEHRIADPTAEVTTVGGDQWDLSALGVTPGEHRPALTFATERNTGVAYRPDRAETLKRIAYLLINRKVPATVALAPGGRGAVDYLTFPTIRANVTALRRFMEWAEEHYGAETLSDCTPVLMDQYAVVLAGRGLSHSAVRSNLHPLYRLSQMAKWLPPADRLSVPSWKWETPGAVQVRVNPAGSARHIIEAEVSDPLLTWGLAFTRDFAADIFAVRDHAMDRLAAARPATNDEVSAWMADYLQQTGDRLPIHPYSPKTSVAVHYLAYLSGFDHASLYAWFRRRGKARAALIRDPDMARPLDVTISGTIHDGLPWTDGIDFYDVAHGAPINGEKGDPLLEHLRTACYIVLGFLSGCRPQEMRTLPREGSLVEVPPPEPGGITGYLLRGVVRRGRQDGGDPAEWATIKPGADAVAVAERLAGDSHWLFPDSTGERPLTTPVLNRRVNEFIDYVNAMPVQGRLPAAFRIGDEDGASVTSRQFRRTIAWHIESQPEGEFALGVQYQHVSTTLGRDGYASVRDVGVKKMMDAEAAAAQQATLVAVSEAILGGAGVSGPSADRLMVAAQLAAPLRATYVAPQTLKRILTDTDAQVFNNPSQHSLCVYVPSRAKCAGTDDEPDRGSCVADCANHARTDIQMDVLAAEVEQYRAEAASPLAPEPVRVRLLQVAEDTQHRVDEHRRTRRYLPIVTITEGAEGGPDGS